MKVPSARAVRAGSMLTASGAATTVGDVTTFVQANGDTLFQILTLAWGLIAGWQELRDRRAGKDAAP